MYRVEQVIAQAMRGVEQVHTLESQEVIPALLVLEAAVTTMVLVPLVVVGVEKGSLTHMVVALPPATVEVEDLSMLPVVAEMVPMVVWWFAE